jgi:enamine deaminase RidA (YjgF/YER057c/UK114 family)
MERREVNPWEWSKPFGFSQAIEVRGASRLLVCSGQTAIGDDGSPPPSPDMADQVRRTFENLRMVLAQGAMSMANVVRLNYFTTDVDELIAVLGPIASEFLAGNLCASTLVGVTRLAFPEIKLEIEALAAS